MRSRLGQMVALSMAGVVMLVTGASGAGAAPGDTSTTEPSTTTTSTTTTSPSTTTSTTTTTTATTTTTTTTTSTTTTTTTTTTTAPPLLVAELPSSRAGVTPSRGTQLQVTETLPPPPTVPPSWILPADSGSGRRIVYSKTRQRVWTVESSGAVSKTHLVSGRRTWNQPLPGTYSVFSRSSYTCNIKNPAICWRYMVRFAKGPGGDNIGFHEIPTDNRTGYKLQSISQLGTPLSGGCVRQAPSDAVYMWNWAPVGTKVVVLP